MSDKSHLWYSLKPPLLFFTCRGFSCYPLKRLRSYWKIDWDMIGEKSCHGGCVMRNAFLHRSDSDGFLSCQRYVVLKGEQSKRRDRDRPPHRSWLSQHRLLFSSANLPSPQVKFQEGFEPRTKYCFFFELATGKEFFDCVLAKGKFTDHDTIVCSVLNSVDYFLHHGIVHFPFSSFSLHLLDRSKNILCRSSDPDSDIVIVDFGMQVHFPPSILLFIFSQRKPRPFPR